MSIMEPNSSSQYFLKKADESLYGPTDLAVLQQWAREGRVAPDDLISRDRSFWYPAPTLTALDMNWLVQLPDGTQYGPIHLQAVKELVDEGSLSLDDTVINRITDRTCSIRDALAAESETLARSPESTQEPTPQAPIPSSRETKVAAAVETTTATAPSESPQTVSPEPQKAKEKTAETPAETAEPTAASWREMAARKDFLERELAKWKKMYEQEHANFLRVVREVEDRVQGLRKSELAALTRADQLERKLKESEENYRMLRESLHNDPTRPHAQQIADLTELYRSLAQRYDAIARLLQEKNAEINALLEAREKAEAQASEMMRQAQSVMEQERKEADMARRRAIEIETDYLELVRAYRELNEKFMQVRDELAASRAPASAARSSKKA